MSIKKQRESGVELLKILAMLLICIFHVSCTLYTKSDWFDSSYVIVIGNVTSNINQFILNWISGLGGQGNIIFFICTSWFLLDSKKVNKKKIAYIIANVWVVNIIFLVIFKLGNWYNIPIRTVIKCLFPTTLQLNWYVTFYLLFYCIHTSLNKIIFSLTKKQLLSSVIVMLILYFVIDLICGGNLYGLNYLICFIVIYFAIAYMKLYLTNYASNMKLNVIGLIIGVAGTIVLMILTNFLGNYISFLSNRLTHWNRANSPFFLLTGISLFNLFRHKVFFNKEINFISSLTLLIYIIHENCLIAQYLRPIIWKYIYENFGYSHIIIKDICFGFILFICSMIIALIYKKTIQKLINKVCDHLYKYLSILYNKIINALLKFS